MQRYFISASNWSSDENIIIAGDDVHHIVRVMRMKEGDKIICNQSGGKAATCEISHIENDQVIASVVEWRNEIVELPIHVTIAQGLPKGDKLELIFQKGTELGASAFIPFQADRSIVKWDKKKAGKKIERFVKIVKEASEQAHRTVIPSVDTVLEFQKLLEKSKSFDVKLFAYEEEARTEHFKRLSDALTELKTGQSLLVCIGPEGGFSDKEVSALKDAGFSSVRLGPRILRTETAAMYLLSSISYHFEELR